MSATGSPARTRLLFLAWALWAAFFLSRDYQPAVRKIDDGAQYLLIAKGFAEGKGYANLAMPGVPDFVELPSAFPLALVAYWEFLAPHEAVLHVLLALAMAGGAWFAFLWLRSLLPEWQAFLVLLAFTANPQAVILATSVMTEAPCVLLIYAGLWLSWRDAERGGRGPEGWFALLCWLVLFRLRINTGSFLLVNLAVLAWRRDFAKVAAGAALAGLWILFERLHSLPPGNGGGYVEYGILHDYPVASHPVAAALGLLKDYAAHFYSYASATFGEQVLPLFYYLHPMDKAKRALILALSLWGLWGLVLLWRKHPRYHIAILAFLLMWAPVFIYWRTLYRYMLPSTPLLLACLILPFAELRKPKARLLWAAAALALVILNQAAYTATYKSWSDYWGEERDAYFRIHDYIRKAAVKPDLLIAQIHYYSYLETGVPSVNVDRQWRWARERHLADGKRVWGMFAVPYAGAEKSVDAGRGWCLGPQALIRAGVFELREVAPCATPAPEAQATER